MEDKSTIIVENENETDLYDKKSVPAYMSRKSSKKILNKKPPETPTKKLRMKSLLWIKPSAAFNVSGTSSSSSVISQVKCQLF